MVSDAVPKPRRSPNHRWRALALDCPLPTEVPAVPDPVGLPVECAAYFPGFGCSRRAAAPAYTHCAQ